MSAPAIWRLGVIGAGQMGTGIAQTAAMNGIHVTLVDDSSEAVSVAKTRMSKSLQRFVRKSDMSAEEAEKALEQVDCNVNVDALRGCNFAIEAVVEEEKVKKATFAYLDKILDPDAIIASNTSSISITRLASATKRPGNMIGMHFMNPVPLMKLVEVVPGIGTSQQLVFDVGGPSPRLTTTVSALRVEQILGRAAAASFRRRGRGGIQVQTVRSTLSLAAALGKSVITSADRAGFVVNRILMPMINEAFFALMEGVASAEDIDAGMKLGTNQPMGPLTLADFIGLDTCLFILRVLHNGLGESKYRPCPLLIQHVDAGWLGRKSGRGVFKYD